MPTRRCRRCRESSSRRPASDTATPTQVIIRNLLFGFRLRWDFGDVVLGRTFLNDPLALLSIHEYVPGRFETKDELARHQRTVRFRVGRDDGEWWSDFTDNFRENYHKVADCRTAL